MAGMSIKNQVFGQATTMGKAFSKLKFDGIVGLAFQEIADRQAEPIIDNMKRQNLISKRVFSFRLHRDDEETDSELFIGGVDEDSYWPPLQYFPILDGGYWLLHLDAITETSNTIDICPYGCNAIVDTGTSLIAAPWKVVQALNTKILNASYNEKTKGFVLDCSRLAYMPNITFSIQSQPFVLTPREYVLKVSVRNVLLEPSRQEMRIGKIANNFYFNYSGWIWTRCDMFIRVYAIRKREWRIDS